MTLTDSSSKGGRQRRTEEFDIRFKDGLAAGWYFSVPEAFRDQLDIAYSTYIDRGHSTKQHKVYLC